MRMRKQHGFTLIELSIVLVIVGLLVGGILVGQELINTATLRSQISQVEKYNTSVNTFRTKYGFLPGDTPPVRATQLGFFAETTLGSTPGHQDGNGLIEGGGAGAVDGIGEMLGFWRHLSDARMIDGSFGITGNAALDPATGGVTANLIPRTVPQAFPPARIGRGNYVVAFSTSGRNAFEVTGITALTTAGAFTLESTILGREAQFIDRKLDDGEPVTGKVRATRREIINGTPDMAFAPCGSNVAPSHYIVSSETPACQLILDFN